jgi:hypothetical protein
VFKSEEEASAAYVACQRLPFANPSEEYLRRDRIQRAIELGQRPDPDDLVEERADEIRYRRKVAEAFEKAQRDLLADQSVDSKEKATPAAGVDSKAVGGRPAISTSPEPPEPEPPLRRRKWYQGIWKDEIKPLFQATSIWIKWGLGLFLFGLTMIQIAEYLFALFSFTASGVFFVIWIASWDGLPKRRGLTRILKGTLYLTVAGAFVVFTLILVSIKGRAPWSHLSRFLRKQSTSVAISPPNTPTPSDKIVFLIRHQGAVAFPDFPQPLLYEYGGNDDLAPVGLAINVEVTNNRSTKTKIAQYAADIQTDGRWYRILSLPMSPSHTVYFLNLRDIRRAMRCKFEPAIFDSIADNKALDPGEPLEGWMFFEWPAELRRTSVLIDKVRIKVRNSQNETAEAVFDNHAPPSEEAGASLFDNGGTFCRGTRNEIIDLSNRTIRPLRD